MPLLRQGAGYEQSGIVLRIEHLKINIKTTMERDNVIFDLIEQEHQRQLRGIESGDGSDGKLSDEQICRGLSR